MLGLTSRGLGAVLLAAGLGGVVVASACAEKKGALMLAINTDMKAPKDVNAVSVTISSNGAIKHSFIGRVTPQGEVLLPATLAIVEPDDSSASIRIRVMAFQDRQPRVLRDVRTTIPGGGRTALLRIPLNFVSDKSATGAPLPDGIVPDPLPGTAGNGSSNGTSGSSGGIGSGGAADFDFFGSYQPPCPDIQNQTIIDGECRDNFVDPDTLPDFDPDLVGDGTNAGSCFELARCFANASAIGSSQGETRPPVGSADDAGGAKEMNIAPRAVSLDLGTCSIALDGADPGRLNLAIATSDTGECVRPGECYVPLDRGPSGWQDNGGRVQLPAYVCKLVSGKNLRIVAAEGTCAAKEEKNAVCSAKPGEIVDGGALSGPRRMVSLDFPSWATSSPDGTLFVSGQSGLVVTAPLSADGPPVVAARTVIPGDGTNVPRSFNLLSGDLRSFVMSEGNHAWVSVAGRPVRRLDFEGQVVSAELLGSDIIFGVAVRSGNAVFRLPLGAEAATPPTPLFDNKTGKLLTNVISLVDQTDNAPTGYMFAFEDGSIANCDGTASCANLVRPQSFPTLGRIDTAYGLTIPSASSFAWFHHSKGVARMDRVLTDGQAPLLTPVPVINADLTGLTDESGYYPRGFVDAPSGDCVYYADAANRVRFKNLASQAEGTLFTANVPVLDLSYLTIGGTDFLLWTMFARASDNGGIWGVPIPETCRVAGRKPPPPVEEDAGPTTCPSTKPIDVSGYPWKAPFVSLGSCTQGELDALVAYLGANPATTYQDLQSSVGNAACRSCIFGLEGAAQWTPFLSPNGVSNARVNVGACIALASASDACGRAYQHFIDCRVLACVDCPAGNAAALNACLSKSASGACKTAFTNVDVACGGGTVAADAEMACQGVAFNFEGPVKAQCITGVP